MSGAGTAGGQAPRRAIEVRAFSGEAALRATEDFAPAWAALCDATGVSPFMRPEWVLAHVHAFEKPGRLRLLLAFEAHEQLAGVLPLIAERVWFRGIPIRRLRAAANHHTLHFDLVCPEGAEGEAVAVAMWERLATERWSCIELRDVPAGGRAELLVNAAAARGCPTGRWTSPIETRAITVEAESGGVAPEFQHTSRKFRAELRRTRRRLEERGELRFEAIEQAENSDLEAFFEIEAGGWKGAAGGNAILRKKPAVRRFYVELAEAAARHGRFRLHRLCLNGKAIAMSYGLLGAEAFYPIRWCYDETFAAYGPGHLLIEAILRECAAEGRSRFAFLGEAFEYEGKWAPDGRAHGFLYIFRATGLGRLLHGLKFGRND